MSNDETLRQKLTGVTTATLTALLVQRGYRYSFMVGADPLVSGQRVCGRAVTVRFGPTRPDLAPKPDDRMQSEPLFQAIEALQPGDFLVIDAGGDLTGGTVGDILAARMRRLGAVGLLIDGAVRDIGQIREFVGLPVWARGAQGSGYQPYLACLERDRPVRCFSVTVLPGDYIVADEDGAVAIPAALAAEVAEAGLEVEAKETYIRGLVEQGASTREVYPPNDETLRRFEAAREQG